MAKHSDLKQVQNVKIIGNKECVTQHKLFVSGIKLRKQIRKQHNSPPKRCVWKLQKSEFQEKYKKSFEESINSSTLLSCPDLEADVESIRTEIKSCLINACDSVCGRTKGTCKQIRATWWWDETIENVVKQKRKLCK